jgi:hypothetical protein
LGDAAHTSPVCGAQPATFKRFRGVYWLDALDPFAALEHLRSTPEILTTLVEAAADADASLEPADGGWSLRQAVTHLRDAQAVLVDRVNLILGRENPLLESKAVFEWARNEAD